MEVSTSHTDFTSPSNVTFMSVHTPPHNHEQLVIIIINKLHLPLGQRERGREVFVVVHCREREREVAVFLDDIIDKDCMI